MIKRFSCLKVLDASQEERHDWKGEKEQTRKWGHCVNSLWLTPALGGAACPQVSLFSWWLLPHFWQPPWSGPTNLLFSPPFLWCHLSAGQWCCTLCPSLFSDWKVKFTRHFPFSPQLNRSVFAGTRTSTLSFFRKETDWMNSLVSLTTSVTRSFRISKAGCWLGAVMDHSSSKTLWL